MRARAASTASASPTSAAAASACCAESAHCCAVLGVCAVADVAAQPSSTAATTMRTALPGERRAHINRPLELTAYGNSFRVIGIVPVVMNVLPIEDVVDGREQDEQALARQRNETAE